MPESCPNIDTADFVRKKPRVIKGRFYVIAPLSDSWEAFTPPHTGVMVQLKGNLTHMDRAHAIYWLKTCSFIISY